MRDCGCAMPFLDQVLAYLCVCVCLFVHACIVAFKWIIVCALVSANACICMFMRTYTGVFVLKQVLACDIGQSLAHHGTEVEDWIHVKK